MTRVYAGGLSERITERELDDEVDRLLRKRDKEGGGIGTLRASGVR